VTKKIGMSDIHGMIISEIRRTDQKLLKERMNVIYENNQEDIEADATSLQKLAAEEGVQIPDWDANALVTAIGGNALSAGLKLSVVGAPVGVVIDVMMGVKAIYDFSQVISALGETDDILEGIIGRRAVYGLTTKPLTTEETDIIAQLPLEDQLMIRRNIVSAVQYFRRSLVSLVSASPDDAASAAVAVGLAVAPVDKMIIGISKAQSVIVDAMPFIKTLAGKPGIVGLFASFITSTVFAYNLGKLFRVLGILQPGKGDHLETYVDPASGTRGAAAGELARRFPQMKKELPPVDLADNPSALTESLLREFVVEYTRAR